MRVYPYGSTSTYYNLNVSATPVAPPDYAGNTTASARNISVGSTNSIYTDWVGSADTNDYCRFSLSQNSNFQLSLNSLTANADVENLTRVNRTRIVPHGARAIDAHVLRRSGERQTRTIRGHRPQPCASRSSCAGEVVSMLT